ncbi:intercellular adhesion molecule 1-like [Cyprinodon tularosa]|uniref:intercellular adhesion molecule 1-like n=1 Tax=Cyprinodon tularosa TaxID=77115 RepID=UPI0018E20A27|nr:intercellular adhesion molecule 1-like [Cyprinodon tularosa]
MCAAGWTLMLLLIHLIGSATSSPFITPDSVLPHLLPPSVRLPPPTSAVSFAESRAQVDCNLTISPSALVVRFGDPAEATCSNPSKDHFLLGWVSNPGLTEPTTDSFLVWSVESVTQWSIDLVCYAASDLRGSCNISLPSIVYNPPKRVSIQFLNHTGPMVEQHQYTLQCTVQDVAPVAKLMVTFYRGHTPLGQLQSDSKAEKMPVNESFTLNIIPSRGDNGSQYWCEAKLDLRPAGPQQPPVETSQNLTAVVIWNQEPTYQTERPMKDHEAKTNHQPLEGSGTTNSYRGCFLLIVPLVYWINGL